MRSPFGNFIEKIAPGAFDDVLRTNPDVLFTWDHDTSLVLARTGAGNLELRTDARGLRYFAEMANTTYARDLQELMRTGVIAQSSFLFRVAPDGEDWHVQPDRTVLRTISRIAELLDVCVTASGAYPNTDSALARTAIQYAVSRNFIQDPQLELRKAQAMAAGAALCRSPDTT
jgi:uncharacterized protein